MAIDNGVKGDAINNKDSKEFERHCIKAETLLDVIQTIRGDLNDGDITVMLKRALKNANAWSYCNTSL